MHIVCVRNAPMKRSRKKIEAPEQGKRLVEGRLKRGFKDAVSAARYFGWNYTTYSQHERGERGLRKDVAERYGKAFRVSSAWLMMGEGPRERSNQIPIIGRIGAGAEILPEFEQVPSDGLYEIESMIPLPEGMIGLEVSGDSMWPRYDNGDIIVCGAKGVAPTALPDGVEAAVQTDDGRRYLKMVRRENGLFILESHNAPPIRNVELVWASEVVNVIRKRQWKLLNSSYARG